MNEYEKLIVKCDEWQFKANQIGAYDLERVIANCANAIEQLLTERKSAERKLQSETKLKAIKDLCMSVPDCGVCLLSIGKTCPTKFWNEWTDEEIETAFDIIYGGEVDDGES